MSTLLANMANTILMFISKLMDIFLKTTKNDNDRKMTSRFIYLGKPIFKGEIKAKLIIERMSMIVKQTTLILEPNIMVD